MSYLCTRKKRYDGVIAQLVEQRTENPCVPGSIPGDTTMKRFLNKSLEAFFYLIQKRKIATDYLKSFSRYFFVYFKLLWCDYFYSLFVFITSIAFSNSSSLSFMHI